MRENHKPPDGNSRARRGASHETVSRESTPDARDLANGSLVSMPVFVPVECGDPHSTPRPARPSRARSCWSPARRGSWARSSRRRRCARARARCARSTAAPPTPRRRAARGGRPRAWSRSRATCATARACARPSRARASCSRSRLRHVGRADARRRDVSRRQRRRHAASPRRMRAGRARRVRELAQRRLRRRADRIRRRGARVLSSRSAQRRVLAVHGARRAAGARGGRVRRRRRAPARVRAAAGRDPRRGRGAPPAAHRRAHAPGSLRVAIGTPWVLSDWLHISNPSTRRCARSTRPPRRRRRARRRPRLLRERRRADQHVRAAAPARGRARLRAASRGACGCRRARAAFARACEALCRASGGARRPCSRAPRWPRWA